MQTLKSGELLVDEFFENSMDLDPEAFQWQKETSLQQDPTEFEVKITHEGQPCRKCSTPVIKKIPKRKHKPGQAYYFEYYYQCPRCKTMYMVEEAKRFIGEQRLL
jgi:uncharacterized protein with PIN domain